MPDLHEQSSRVEGVVVCHWDDLAPEVGRTFVVDGEQVAVFRLRDGELRAVQAVCPHRAGPIADGQCDARIVMCPLHQYAFDLADGTCTNGDIPALRTWPVELDAHGRVVVG